MSSVNFSKYGEVIDFIEKTIEQGVRDEFDFFYTTEDSLLHVLEDVDYLMIKRGLGDKVKLSLKELTPDMIKSGGKFKSHLTDEKKLLLIKVTPA